MKWIKLKNVITKITFVIALIVNKAAFAGPPFLTDDPQPVEYHHYEIDLFSSLDKNNVPLEEPQLQAPAFELDWGAFHNIQLHLVVPYVWSLPTGAAPAANGIGDIEVGVKYRFIEETSNRPQVGIFPLLELPSGDVNQYLGNGKRWMMLPVWMQKSWGAWTLAGGAGYALNSAKGLCNYFYSGWQLHKDLNEHLTLGAEIFSQGVMSTQSRPFTIFNAGGSYNFTKHFSLLFNAGHSVLGEQHLIVSVGLYWTGGGKD